MEQSAFFSAFYEIFTANGLSAFATEENATSFYRLTEHMLAVGSQMNLTAIKEERAILLRHYADSLRIAAYLPQNATVLDVGCGAGFPSLPLALCRKDLTITAMDSTEKRIRYVNQTAQLLGVDGRLSAIAMRAEEGAHTALRETFDAGRLW